MRDDDRVVQVPSALPGKATVGEEAVASCFRAIADSVSFRRYSVLVSGHCPGPSCRLPDVVTCTGRGESGSL